MPSHGAQLSVFLFKERREHAVLLPCCTRLVADSIASCCTSLTTQGFLFVAPLDHKSDIGTHHCTCTICHRTGPGLPQNPKPLNP